MQMKLISTVVALLAGALVGAYLGYGPLMKFKSDGLLSMEIGVNEYKRFAELANDPVSFNQYVAVNRPPNPDGYDSEKLQRSLLKGEWYKAIAKVSKFEAKEVPDALLQVAKEREREKDKERESIGTRMSNQEIPVYMGLRISYISDNALNAAASAKWLGQYFKEISTREAIREQVARWSADLDQYSDRAHEQKLKYLFASAQAKFRVLELKKLINQYPESIVKDNRQVVDVRKDNEKFMSPLAQLVGAESEIIGLNEKIQKLNREMEQSLFAASVVRDAEAAISNTRSGSESVSKLAAIIEKFSKNIKTDAEKEKLLSLAADLSQISSRFLSQAEFVAQPSISTQPERPMPLTYVVLLALCFGGLAIIINWRKRILNYFYNSNIASD